jgi:S-(hydroxymethyl)glutathione dehydrogenase/alcohol dehydrogenase
MQVRGAVAHAVGKPWTTETLELADPGPGEVRVKVMASGVCHSDEHVVTGDSHVTLPHVGGHEGAGIVDAVGPGVTRVRVGDHVATAFLPACGRCRWCAEGMQYICDDGGESWTGMMLDGTARFFLPDGTACGAFQRLGTFANYLVTPQEQCIPIPEDVPFEIACLVSCGVTTGWGAAVNAAAVRPRDTVLVMGVGGVGINAVQGAAHAGAAHIVAVDPMASKREAALGLGATRAFASVDEAMPFVRSVTNGQGADASILTVGRLDRTLVGEAFRAVRKEGRCAVVSFGVPEKSLDIDAVELVAYAKTLRGVLFGNANPTADIPRLLDYYRAGHLRLDELITARYSVDQVAQAYEDMHAGRNLRGVLLHEH